jgi:O-acetyl-ADP-ribose deacetylase
MGVDARIEVVEGDITRLDADAIVNAANQTLAPGGGVCGAIHRAAGPELWAACRDLAPCPTGDARITPGFHLPARHVIHAVGPVWHGGGQGEDETLAQAYRASLLLAARQHLHSIAFPAISTGIYGFPKARAASIAVAETRRFLARHPEIERVIFCCFDGETASLCRAALKTGAG